MMNDILIAGVEALTRLERMNQLLQLSPESRKAWGYYKELQEHKYTHLKRPLAMGEFIPFANGGYCFSFFDADGGKHIYDVTTFQLPTMAVEAMSKFVERMNVRG